MEVEKISKQGWENLLLKDVDYGFNFLALKILLSRLRLKVAMDPSPVSIQKSVEEIKNLFIRFGNLPSVQKDFQKVYEREGLR
ncbi:MAG: hypothetical protein GX202_04450 [Firmicutes bacterium]|nr:hypothetical protein [Bacillota bacterium]